MAVHVLNMLPTTTLSYQAPFEVLFGFFSSNTILRVFGCICYPILSSSVPHKLAPHSSSCVYGPSFNHRGYRCLNLITNNVIIHLHVPFDEDHFPYPSFHDSTSSQE